MNGRDADARMDQRFQRRPGNRSGWVGYYLGSTAGLCLLLWVVLFSTFLLFVFLNAVVLGNPARYFSALFYLTVAYVACGGAVVEICERLGISREASEPQTKAILLVGIGLVGMVVVGLLMMLLLAAGGVWTPAGGMLAARPAPAGGGPAPAQQPAAPPPFEEGGGKPAHLPGEAPAAGNLPGLIAWWPFDEAQGAKASDASGNGRHGTVHGGARVPGVRGKAARFAARDAYFDYGSGPAFNFAANAPFSFAGWIRTRAEAGTILSQRNSTDGGADIEVSLRAGRLTALVREDGGEFGEPAVVAGPAVRDGVWHHFALTRKAGGIIELFVDGRSQGEKGTPQSRGAITTNLRSLAREQYWLTVRAGPGWAHWDGCADEFCVFDRALTDPEVRRLAGL
jgi:hypothetical protein